MKKIILTIVLFGACIFSDAQVQRTPINLSTTIVCVDVKEGEPLVVVGSFETEMKNFAIDANNIEKIDVLKNSAAAIKKYGSKAQSGVIVITAKPGTDFYTFADFVNPEINLNKSGTKIQLNGVLLTDMKKLLVDKSVFKQSMISTDTQRDEKGCIIIIEETLVITTTLKD